MELLELLCLLPNLLEAVLYLFRGLWWLVRGIWALVVLIALFFVDVGCAIGRGFRRLLDWLRDRDRDRDFPTATVVVDRNADHRADNRAL